MNRIIAVVAAAGLASGVMGQVTASSVAVLTGTIQPGGPRQGVNGDRFFNIEGLNNGAFSSYGVARWDLTQVRADFDAAFRAGQWQIAAVELELTQDNAAFSLSGPVAVYYTPDDVTDIKTTASPLFYPLFDPLTFASDLPLGNGGNPVLSYTFTLGVTGDLDRYTQAGGSHAGGPVNPAEALALAPDLVQDIRTDNFLTLVFNDGDPATAATYRGQESFSGRVGPNLFITAVGTGGCYANCDQSTGSPLLTANDFQCFLNTYAAGASYANCDGSTGSPALTANDFQCFLNKYAAGCS
ncbi:MAG: hypothetical protein KF678_04865 [Phycisphaeraceae bacterium]|nr:hypothetical protein [Phycisphaeraceae bacterium]